MVWAKGNGGSAELKPACARRKRCKSRVPVTKMHQAVGGEATPRSRQYASGGKGNDTDTALVE